MNIDVQGAPGRHGAVPRRRSRFSSVPAPLEELERRLRGRGTESEEAIRTAIAKGQATNWSLADRYRYQVINDDMDRAVEEICCNSDSTMGERAR